MDNFVGGQRRTNEQTFFYFIVYYPQNLHQRHQAVHYVILPLQF